MCMLVRRKDRSFWKELDDDLIYYQKDMTNQYNYSPLRIKNIYADKIIEYNNIVPKALGVLQKGNSYLNVFIETQRQTIIARLDRTSLNLKTNYRICSEYLFYQGPIYYFNKELLLILQNRRLIQMVKNKLIRKYKGKLQQVLRDDILTRMGLRSFNLLRKENYLFFQQFQTIFEKQFNISLRDIDERYGRHIFKKIGDFLILKKHYKYQFVNQEQLPVYYLSIDYIIKGDGMKGKICLNHTENLKMIKCFNNVLYIVITQNGQFEVYEIKGEHERELIQQVTDKSSLKKPILYQKHIIFTDKNNRATPKQQEIKYKKEIKTK